jgi:hypothetical protein
MGIQLPVGGRQATFRWSLAGDPDEMVSTLGYVNSGATTIDFDAESAWNAATGTGSIAAAGNMFNAYTFVGVTAYEMTSGGLLVGEFTSPVVGTGGGNPLPSNCAVLVHKRTALGGRRGRGRMYLPPFTAGELDVGPSGVIDGPDYTAIQDELDVFYGLMVSNDLQPSLYHSDGGSGNIITSLVLDTRIATQRRRMRN